MSADFWTIVHGLQAKKIGSQWMAKCPSHDDRNPSLSIKQNGDKALVCCMARCSQRSVIESLRNLGLWGERPSGVITSPVAVPPVQPEPKATPAKKEPCVRTIDTEYSYVDRAGTLLFQIIRKQPIDGSRRTFSQRQPDAHGGWIYQAYPADQRVLYRLPEVLESPIIFLVEGERDVETLRGYGFTATTNALGCNQPWLPAYTEALAGREVYLIPDNDQPGREHMLKVMRALLPHVAKLSVIELDEGCKDVSDWFSAGHSELELIDSIEALEVAR
jgi:putative DNA primase/helicase